MIDRMCSSGWGGAAGWGLGQAAGRNQKEEKKKTVAPEIANTRGKLARKGGQEGFRAHLHSYPDQLSQTFLSPFEIIKTCCTPALVGALS